MKRKIKIDNLIKNDMLYIGGRDWISYAMNLYKYQNELILIKVDEPKNFEIEIEVVDSDIMIRVRHNFYIPLEFVITLNKYITHIKLNRMVDPVY